MAAPPDGIQFLKPDSAADGGDRYRYLHDASSEHASNTLIPGLIGYPVSRTSDIAARTGDIVDIPEGRRRLTGVLLLLDYCSEESGRKARIEPEVMCRARSALGLRPVSWIGGQMHWNESI